MRAEKCIYLGAFHSAALQAVSYPKWLTGLSSFYPSLWGKGYADDTLQMLLTSYLSAQFFQTLSELYLGL